MERTLFMIKPDAVAQNAVGAIIQQVEQKGFRVVEMRPVHSLAQTLGWLLWAHLEERRSRLGKLLFWLPIFLASRLSQHPPEGQTQTANSFQAVLVKI